MVMLLGTCEYDTPPANIILMMLIYITNIICTKICTLDIKKTPTYLGYVTGANIRASNIGCVYFGACNITYIGYAI